MIKFVVGIEPIPQARPRFSCFGSYYETKAIKAYKDQKKQPAIQAMKNKTPMQGELKASLKFYRKYKTISQRFGDCDNLLKAILDEINGVCYDEDLQIVCCISSKHTDKNYLELKLL